MKRSKHIHLVLVTAVLASCNRMIIPADPSAPYVPDPTLTMAPAYIDSSYNCDCAVNDNDEYYSSYPHYGYFYNSYYRGWRQGSIFYTGHYRSPAIVRSNHFVARGGFGKLGVSAAT